MGVEFNGAIERINSGIGSPVWMGKWVTDRLTWLQGE